MSKHSVKTQKVHTPTLLVMTHDGEGLRAGGSVWVWESRAKRYRNTKNGRFIGHGRMYDMRNQMIDQQKDQVADLTGKLWAKDVSLAGWRRGMREALKETYTLQYVLAKGGRNSMTPRDWGILGQMLRQQYEALDSFTRDLASGRYATGEIGRVKQRAGLYMSSSAQAFERAKTETHGLPRLPYYPGDGSTVCKTNCRCQWVVKNKKDSLEVIWRLGAADHCTDCIIRAARHSAKNPLVFIKGQRGPGLTLESRQALLEIGVRMPLNPRQKLNTKRGVAHVS